jgi:hypothetical protein
MNNNQEALAQYLQHNMMRNNTINKGKKMPEEVPQSEQFNFGSENDVFNDISLSGLENVDLTTTEFPANNQGDVITENFTNEPVQGQKKDIRRSIEEDIFEKLEKICRKSIDNILHEQRSVLAGMFKRNVKSRSKPKNSEIFKQPNYGFKNPLELTDLTCEFLGLERGSKLSRPQLTRNISQYIKDNGLKDQTTSMIRIDGNLARLFKIDDRTTPAIKHKDINGLYLSGCFTRFAKNN